MPRRTETWEWCRWTRIEPLVNVVAFSPTEYQLLFRKKWTVVQTWSSFPKKIQKVFEIVFKSIYQNQLFSI